MAKIKVDKVRNLLIILFQFYYEMWLSILTIYSSPLFWIFVFVKLGIIAFLMCSHNTAELKKRILPTGFHTLLAVPSEEYVKIKRNISKTTYRQKPVYMEKDVLCDT